MFFYYAGDLTQKGFNKQHKQLWDEFKLQLDGKTPEKLQLNSNDTIEGNRTHKTRTLKMVGIENNQGFLPWEKQQMFSHLQKVEFHFYILFLDICRKSLSSVIIN